MLRDQAPLNPSNMQLTDGLTFPDYIRMLNDRVFLWPGNADGPISPGRNHFARYCSEDCRVLVMRTDQLLTTNQWSKAELCRFNSGAPRYSGGRASPRGKATFLRPFEFDGTPSDVIELTWPGRVTLPTDLMIVDAGRYV